MSTPSKHTAVLSFIRRSFFGGVAVVFMMLTAAPYALAEGTNNAPSATGNSCSPVAPAPTGITQPTGADSVTYTYNACTGLWENHYYTWSPATKIATPKTPIVYTCDTTHWQWTYNQWLYSPSFKAFRQVPFTTAQLPGGAVVDANSLNPCAPPPAPVQPNTAGTAGAAPSSNGRPDGTAAAGTMAVDNAGNVIVGNQIGSTALSGNAAVTANTAAGDAASGNANATANVVNNVASSSSLAGGNVVTFTANINGDVQGDLVIDPSQIQPASDGAPLTNTDVTVNTKDSGTINNDINLNAASGNASAAANTKAGNVTTGNATAVANVINVLNSIVSAGKSFIGVININGNLHGNILVPQAFLSQLLATNAPHTTMTLSASDATNLGIANNVSNNATSGNATAAGNTLAGNVASGSAVTKVTIFNLTGAQLAGSNCMLVFVNVSGAWVGVIMNAPAGSTAAAVGDAASKFAVNTATVGTATNNAITNNVTVAAASGNASATDNTQAGNVKSGNADTAVNLLNLNNTQLSLSGWFGVLFINVFGNWFGNFGVSAPPAHGTGSGAGGHGSKPASRAVQNSAHQVFQFVQHAHDADLRAASAATGSGGSTTLALLGAQLAGTTGRTLNAGVETVGRSLKPAPVAVHHGISQLQLAGSTLMILGISTLVVERALGTRSYRRADIEAR